jgi:hypothetical protein
MRDGAGDIEPPFHPPGKSFDLIMSPVVKPGEDQRGVYRCLEPLAVQPVKGSEKAQVALGAQFLIQRHLLRHDAEGLFVGAQLPADFDPLETDFAAVAAERGRENINRRTFAGAIGTEDAQDLAAIHFKADIFEHFVSFKTFGQMTDTNQIFHCNLHSIVTAIINRHARSTASNQQNLTGDRRRMAWAALFSPGYDHTASSP